MAAGDEPAGVAAETEAPDQKVMIGSTVIIPVVAAMRLTTPVLDMGHPFTYKDQSAQSERSQLKVF
jgi:hypothetical protein